jgi:hypothetical protein
LQTQRIICRKKQFSRKRLWKGAILPGKNSAGYYFREAAGKRLKFFSILAVQNE